MTNPPIEPYNGEPWEPHVFKKGDRVRQRACSECVCPECGGPQHGDDITGWEGTVRGIREPGTEVIIGNTNCSHSVKDRAHRFEVEWDKKPHWLGQSAAMELEPLEGE